MEVIHQYKVTEDSVTIYDEDGGVELVTVRQDGFELHADDEGLSCRFVPSMASQVSILRLFDEAFAAKVFIALHLFDIRKPEFQQIVDIEELLDSEVYKEYGYITRGSNACLNSVFFFHKDDPKTIFYLQNDIGEYHLCALKDGKLYKVEDRQDAEYFGNRHLHDIAERMLKES